MVDYFVCQKLDLECSDCPYSSLPDLFLDCPASCPLCPISFRYEDDV